MTTRNRTAVKAWAYKPHGGSVVVNSVRQYRGGPARYMEEVGWATWDIPTLGRTIRVEIRELPQRGKGKR